MTTLDIIKSFFHFMPMSFYFSVLGLLSGLYFVLIGPILFKFWIMPRIEKRYNTKLVVCNIFYNLVLFGRWVAPSMEIPVYIVAKFFGFNIGNQRIMLKRINYQITKESKPEIIISFISLFFLVAFIVLVIYANLTRK